MRYFNQWNGPVIIPAATFEGVELPEQHLNNTIIRPLNETVEVVIRNSNQIGLIQGFLTIPFLHSAPEPFADQTNPFPFIWNYFDIAQDQEVCEDKPWKFDGKSRDYQGIYFDRSYDSTYSTSGVGDAHTGLDYSVDLGKFVVHAAPESDVWYLPTEDDLRVHTMFTSYNNIFRNTYAHNSVQLVELRQPVLRGQIIAFTGNTGGIDGITGGYTPQLHFDVSWLSEGCDNYLDLYRSLVEPTGTGPYSGNAWSMWTVDNLPFFPSTMMN